MTLPFNGSTSVRFGNSRRLIRLLTAGMAMVFAGVSMADPVTVTLSNLTHTYNGSPKSATVTTSPIVAACTVTYAGSTTPPTNFGSYAVVATVDPPNTGLAASGTLVISKANQTITFAALSAKTFGDAPYNLTATSSSGLTISYISSNTTIATISGSTVTIKKAGATRITASQPGNTNYFAAASVDQVLTVNKKTLNYSLVVPAGKTYGDAPFTVSATVSDGFSIDKWESADPSVATISPTGEVTIVGAGQTSIIANIPSTAGTNYVPTWVARPLNVARLEAPMPSPSGTETVTYDGNPHGVDPASLPAGLATETTYRHTSTPEATATPTVVFQNGPDTLDLSYDSVSFSVGNIWSQAKYVELGGTGTVGAPRKLHSCDVTLVTWAGYYGGNNNDPTYRFKEWADVHPDLVVLPPDSAGSPAYPAPSVPGNSGGWYHPVTLAFYEYDIVGGTESYRLLTSKTVQAFIPWRPVKLADGVTDYTEFNGYAFRVPFDFPEGVILPDQVWVAVSFNTQSSGVSPIGVSGPYNALNTSVPYLQQAGLTLSGTKHFFFKDWRWQQAVQTRGPMLRLRTVPTNATLAAPVNAGNYEVKTQAAAFWEEEVSTSTLEIIGQSFESWRTASFATSGLPTEKTTDIADADGDGLSNFLEYAFNLNPLQGDQPSPTGLEQGGATMAFTYRRNLNALNLDYSIQGSSQLADPLSWAPVTLLGEVPLSDDGATRVIQATVAKPADTPSYFLRSKVASP